MVPLARGAPGDNQFMDTSLSLEHIQPHDSPRFSLLEKADLPSLGRLGRLSLCPTVFVAVAWPVPHVSREDVIGVPYSLRVFI